MPFDVLRIDLHDAVGVRLGLLEFAAEEQVARGVEVSVEVVGQQLRGADVFTRGVRRGRRTASSAWASL